MITILSYLILLGGVFGFSLFAYFGLRQIIL